MNQRHTLITLLVTICIIGSLATGEAIHTVAASTPPTLGAVPQSCPHGPVPYAFDSAIAPGIGHFPVWGVGFLWSIRGSKTPPAVLDWEGGPPPGAWQPGYGWGHKFIWVSKVTYRGRITIHGGGLHGGSLLSFDDGLYPTPTHTLVLDATHPLAETGGDPSWSYFPSSLYIPRAGCYYLEAHWPGGHWRITFAAGRS